MKKSKQLVYYTIVTHHFTPMHNNGIINEHRQGVVKVPSGQRHDTTCILRNHLYVHDNERVIIDKIAYAQQTQTKTSFNADDFPPVFEDGPASEREQQHAKQKQSHQSTVQDRIDQTDVTKNTQQHLTQQTTTIQQHSSQQRALDQQQERLNQERTFNQQQQQNALDQQQHSYQQTFSSQQQQHLDQQKNQQHQNAHNLQQQQQKALDQQQQQQRNALNQQQQQQHALNQQQQQQQNVLNQQQQQQKILNQKQQQQQNALNQQQQQQNILNQQQQQQQNALNQRQQQYQMALAQQRQQQQQQQQNKPPILEMPIQPQQQQQQESYQHQQFEQRQQQQQHKSPNRLKSPGRQNGTLSAGGPRALRSPRGINGTPSPKSPGNAYTSFKGEKFYNNMNKQTDINQNTTSIFESAFDSTYETLRTKRRSAHEGSLSSLDQYDYSPRSASPSSSARSDNFSYSKPRLLKRSDANPGVRREIENDYPMLRSKSPNQPDRNYGLAVQFGSPQDI